MLSELGECDVAAKGDEALDAYVEAQQRGKPYDLICLDIMLPNLSGQEILREIRRHEEAHGIGGLDRVKIIMTTGLSDPQTVLESFREGCEGYIIKPVDKGQLLKQIQKLALIPEVESLPGLKE